MGALCSTCAPGHAWWGGRCKRCAPGDAEKGVAIAAGAVLALVAAVAVAGRWHWRLVREQAAHCRELSRGDLLRDAAERQSARMQRRVATVQKGKILISFVQCVYRVAAVFAIRFPDSVLRFYAWCGAALFSWVPWLPLGCAMRADYFLGLHAMTLGPAAAVLLLVAAEVAYNIATGHRLSRFKYAPGAALFLSFCVFTGVCTAVLSYFHCVELEDGRSYLVPDKAILCTSARYRQMRTYAVAAGVVYAVGTPLVYTLLLLRQRRRIMAPPRARSADERIQSILFLWGAYRPEWYLMEVFDMVRKLVLTCLPMLLTDSSSVTAGGLVWVLLSLAVYQYARPYVDAKDNVLMQATQYQLLLTLFLGLLVKLEVDAREGWNRQMLSACLISTTVAVILLSLFLAVVDHHESVRKWLCCRGGSGKVGAHTEAGHTEKIKKKKTLVPPRDVQRKRNRKLLAKPGDNRVYCYEGPPTKPGSAAAAGALQPGRLAFIDKLTEAKPKTPQLDSPASTAPCSSRDASFRDCEDVHVVEIVEC